MRTSFGPILGLALAFMATPAFAEDATATPAVTINGSAAIVSDYRFRGISQTDKNFAVQGSLTLTHESGFYVSAWGSSISAYVSQGSAQEIDLIGGYKKSFGGTTLDVGALYYFYPKSNPGHTDFIEPYVSVAHTIGPVTGKVTVNYAPKQKALALGQTGTVLDPSRDNVYLGGDLSGGIPNTPISLAAHVGHSFGPSFLVPVGKGYTDWSLGATFTHKALSFGVSYVDTDTVFVPVAKNVAKGGVVFTLGASF